MTEKSLQKNLLVLDEKQQYTKHLKTLLAHQLLMDIMEHLRLKWSEEVKQKSRKSFRKT